VDWAVGGLLASAAVFPLIWLTIFRRDTWLQSWGWTLAGILYMGWMVGHYVMLRQLDDGRELVIWPCSPRLPVTLRPTSLAGLGQAPHDSIDSPHKTWEGAAAVFAGAIAAAGGAALSPQPRQLVAAAELSRAVGAAVSLVSPRSLGICWSRCSSAGPG